jgi:gamma-glutamylcysteine synthetase
LAGPVAHHAGQHELAAMVRCCGRQVDLAGPGMDDQLVLVDVTQRADDRQHTCFTGSNLHEGFPQGPHRPARWQQDGPAAQCDAVRCGFTEQAAFENSPDEGTQELDIWRDVID